MKRRREEDVAPPALTPIADAVHAALLAPFPAPALSPELAQIFLAWRTSLRSQGDARAYRLAALDESVRRASEASERVEQARYELALLCKMLEAQRSGVAVEHADLSALEDEIRTTRRRTEHAATLRTRVDEARAAQQSLAARLGSVTEACATLRSAAALIASRIEQTVAPPPASATLVAPLRQLYLLLSFAGLDNVAVRVVETPPLSASDDYTLAAHGLEVTWGAPPVTFYVAAMTSLADLLVARGASARDDAILSTLVLGDDGAQPSDARLAFTRPGFQFDASIVGRPYRWLARLAGLNLLPPLSESADPAESLSGHELLNYLLTRSSTK